jgi:hypothetical protein
MSQDGGKKLATKQHPKGRLSGYHYFMDRLRSEGELYFYCSCDRSAKVEEKMPLTMRCFCGKLMIVMDELDLPFIPEATLKLGVI